MKLRHGRKVEPWCARFETARALSGPELAVFMHAGLARLVGGRVVGGPLCHLAEWTDPRPVPGSVAATPAILDELDRRLVEPVAESASAGS